MAFDDRRLVSISTRHRFRRRGKASADVAAVWRAIVNLAIRHGADRYALERDSPESSREGKTEGFAANLVELGLEARNLNLFSGDVWLCGISDEGADISVFLPEHELQSVRDAAEAAGLVWDEF